MAARYISMKCPECGATLNVEEGRESFFCSYCGAKITKEYENEKVLRTIDEARIKEADNEMKMRELALKQLDQMEKDEAEDAKKKIYATKRLIIILGVVLLISYTVNKFLNDQLLFWIMFLSGWGLCMAGLTLAIFYLKPYLHMCASHWLNHAVFS